jgi:hypothetical protein
VARVAWRPDADARAAARMTVVVRARAAQAAPDGSPIPDAREPRLTVAAETFDGRVLAESTVAVEGTAPLRVPLALPAAWGEALEGRELVLAFRASDAAALAWFQSAVFHPGADASSPGRKE